jgi:hypothetical protein
LAMQEGSTRVPYTSNANVIFILFDFFLLTLDQFEIAGNSRCHRVWR